MRISRKSKSKHSTDESTHRKEAEIEQNNTALQGELIPSHKHFRMSGISKIKIKQTKWERNKELNEISLNSGKKRSKDKY